MKHNIIPKGVKEEVNEIVARFNETELKNRGIYYTIRYRGQFLYLERATYDYTGPICRLTYTGNMNDWEFVLYSYSKKRYDPDAWYFYGAHHVDGTIEGALRACLEAYSI